MGNIYENDIQALGMARLTGRCVLACVNVPLPDCAADNFTLLLPSAELRARLFTAAAAMGIHSDGLYAVLTDEGRPFYIGLRVNKVLLGALSEKWKSSRTELENVAAELERTINAALPSFEALSDAALEGIKRLRDDPQSRVSERISAIPFLLRASYFDRDRKIRAMAEEDLSRLYRSGIHDHIGGGFFAENTDTEWLVPEYEKRLSDNAVAALVYTEAWRDGHMAFYRETAEETLDYCLRSLTDGSGLFFAGQRVINESAAENPYLLTPDELKKVLGEEEGRHFGECYDITDEANTDGKCIPNLIINQRWSLIPEGYDDYRERVRLYREAKGGVFTDKRTPPGWNGLMLAALAEAADAFSDRRYLTEAEALGELLLPGLDTIIPTADMAFLALGFTCLYSADFSVKYLRAALKLTDTLRSACRDGEGGFLFGKTASERTGANASRGAGALCLTLDRLYLLTGNSIYKEERNGLLRHMFSRPGSYGALAMWGWSALPCAGNGGKTLLSVSDGEGPADNVRSLTRRYCPDVGLCHVKRSELSSLSPILPSLPSAENGLYLSENGLWKKIM